MKALLLDQGLFPELALRLARELDDTIGYFSPWASAFPNPRDQLIGKGLEDFGVERVDFPFELLDTENESEWWLFPDLFYSDLQSYLRRQGKNVWGGGWGELLELDRWKLYELLREQGYDVAPIKTVTGVDALERELGEKEAFIKIAQYYRGLRETYKWRGRKASGNWLSSLRSDVMPAELRYMIQQPTSDEAVEPGIDSLIKHGVLLFPLLLGWEKKDSAILSMVIDKLPDWAAPMQTVIDKLGDEYTNFFSAEIRKTKEQAFLTDATCRLPRPGDAIHLEMWENLGAVMTGEDDELKPAGKYAAQLVMSSHALADHALHVAIPEEFRDRVKLWNFTRDEDGEYWVLPNVLHDPAVGSAVAIGDDVEDVIKECLEIAEAVEADELQYATDAFEDIKRQIEKGETMGVKWD